MSDTVRPITDIRNLGPASADVFARAGLTTAQQIEDLGADAAYEIFVRAGGSAHFIGFYALALGLQGRPWNDAGVEEKRALRLRFDAIKARVAAQSDPMDAIEAELDRIGTGLRRAQKS